jgi:hypothetical protein
VSSSKASDYLQTEESKGRQRAIEHTQLKKAIPYGERVEYGSEEDKSSEIPHSFHENDYH